MTAERDPERFRFGIEAEYALLRDDGRLEDPSTLDFHAVQSVVDRLPRDRHPDLVRGDAGIKATRWYVEGDERFDENGRLLSCVPKGIETRTPPRPGIAAAVRALEEQTTALAREAGRSGWRLVGVGWHPWCPGYRVVPPYNAWELRMRRGAPEYEAPDVYMLSFGPDLNVSRPDAGDAAAGDAAAVDLARKLTFYSPAIVPFSFSSPFREGEPSGLLSVRTHRRTGRRAAARAFVDPGGPLAARAQDRPPLVHPARLPAERGRVEFKALDALPGPAAYPPLMALLAGLALDTTLTGRADVPDAAAHRLSAIRGFDDDGVRSCAGALLTAAGSALGRSPYADLLAPLRESLLSRRTPAHGMIQEYRVSGRVPLPDAGR